MSRHRGRTAGLEARRLLVSLIFAGVIYWVFASGLYIQVVNVWASWYVDQIAPPPGAVTPGYP